MPYVGLPETDDLQVKEVKYRPYKEVAGRNVIKNGDVLFARIEPSIFNRKFIYVENLPDEYAYTSTEFYVLDAKDNIQPLFLLYMLLTDYVYNQFEGKTTGSTGRRRLDKTVFKNLLIPHYSLEKQNEITTTINKAVALKQEKKEQATQLLSSINDYLLLELGIELPEQTDNLESRIFYTKFSDIVEGRLDPFYHKNARNVSESTNYPEKELNEVAIIKKGQSITSSTISEGPYPVIAGGQVSPYYHNKFNFSEDVITVSASGAYAGFVWYHDYPIFASDCSVIYSKGKDILTEYIYWVLKLKQAEIYNMQQGAGQPHVYPSDLGRIKIPFPSFDKQTEIVKKISDIKREALHLQKEGNKQFEEVWQHINDIVSR